MKSWMQLVVFLLLMVSISCGKKDKNPTGPKTNATVIVPKLGEWSTGQLSIAANSTLTIHFPVSLEDGKYSLYYGSYAYLIGSQYIGGTWGDITETDTFSTSQDIPGGIQLAIDGRFVSPTEAKGSISYTGLPTVEWTATWQSE
jgi:hypothetical protein